MPGSNRVVTVLNELQDRITSGRYIPGELLPPERELSAALGVSRGVLREALGILSGMGLIKSRQGSGTYVELPSTQHVSASYGRLLSRLDHHAEHLCAVRLSLETAIAALAATHRTDEHLDALDRTQVLLSRARPPIEACVRADVDFHSTLAEASGNPIFELVLAPIQGLLLQCRRRAIPRFGSRIVFEHHERILAAVRAGDPDKASQLMREHIELSTLHLLECIDASHRAPVAARPASRPGRPAGRRERVVLSDSDGGL
jgi:GntR family transcriptional regulator, transcriptional repressor for pyruvate dehydrogenase complex